MNFFGSTQNSLTEDSNLVKGRAILGTMKTRALRGVNLGGWFIVERWMTPSLFRGSGAHDEFTLAATPQGRKKLMQHRNTFIQEEDFVWMAAHGIELLRIPFGYWLFIDDPEYVGGVEQLDWAMEMAEKYHIKVLLDLHALPGSQNGRDHSGRAGEVGWYDKPAWQDTSRVVCRRVAERYAHSPALWGLQIINEPVFGWRRQFQLLRYYRRVYADSASILPRHVYVVFSDAFRPWLLAGALRRWRGPRVAMDVHLYSWMVPLIGVKVLEQFFKRTQWHRFTICGVQRLAHPVIIGEWGAVLPRTLTSKIGQRTWREAALEHFELQQDIYSSALAQCYWTYKIEGDSMWSYRYIVEKALLEREDGATLEV